MQHHPTRKRADFPAVSRHENHGGIGTEGVANVGGLVPLVLPSPQGHRLLCSIVQPAGCMTADGSFTRPLRCLSRMKGNFHVRLCVQRKAGVFSRRETYQGKSQSPVARRAGGRETNLLKPLDSLIYGMRASFQAVAQANAEVAPKVSSPRGRACNRKGEGSMGRRTLADAADHSGGVGATAWRQGHAEQLEKPSSSHRETGGAR